MTVAEANVALVRRFHDLIGAYFAGGDDLAEWESLWHEDAVYEQAYPAGEPVARQGRAAICAYVRPMSTVFDRFAFEGLAVHATDDPEIVVAMVRSHAVVAATGRPYEQDYVWLFGIRDRRIASWKAYLNPLAIRAAFAPA